LRIDVEIEEDELRKKILRISEKKQSIRVDRAAKNTLIKEDQVINAELRSESAKLVA
jgi:hypothetical protein